MNESRSGMPPADDELWSLVESFVEGTASSDDCRRLETRLHEDETARQFYVAYLDLHAQLQWRTRGKSDRAAAIGTGEEHFASAEDPHPSPRPKREGTVFRRRLIWPSLAAALSLSAAAVVFLAISMPRRGPEDSETPDLPLKPAGSVAVLIDNAAPVWEAGTSGPTKTGSYLSPGRLRLKSGVVEIAFDRGGEILLEGPADFDVSAVDRGFLHRGKLTAKSSQPGSSFFVNMPGAATNIEGECGLLYETSGHAEVHVFAGEVRADPTDARGEALPGGKRIENAAAAIDPSQRTFTPVPINAITFARLRPEVRLIDAAVRDGSHAGENFGAAPELVVKNSIPGYSWETFLRFDLSGVKGPISEATVRLMPLKVGQPMENAAAVVARDDAWSEQAITWDNKPPSSQTIATWSVTGPVAVEFDVTQQVRDALAGDKRLALRIFAPHRKRGSAYVQYGSREGDPNLRPQLLITPAADVQVRRMPQVPQTESGVFGAADSILRGTAIANDSRPLSLSITSFRGVARMPLFSNTARIGAWKEN
jgi:hypothetical protein